MKLFPIASLLNILLCPQNYSDQCSGGAGGLFYRGIAFPFSTIPWWWGVGRECDITISLWHLKCGHSVQISKQSSMSTECRQQQEQERHYESFRPKCSGSRTVSSRSTFYLLTPVSRWVGWARLSSPLLDDGLNERTNGRTKSLVL